MGGSALLIVVAVLCLEAETDAQSPAGRLRSGRVTLLSRQKHDDYEKATFSFVHGIRDDPGLRITRNDWDLQFGNGGDRFSVRMVTDDRSTIRDLGPGTLEDLASVPPPADPSLEDVEDVPAVAGHVYLVHTRDSDDDAMSLFRVAQLVPGDTCTIEWVHFIPDPPESAAALVLSEAARARLIGLLHGARSQAADARRRKLGVLRDPVEILLQIRTGAQGGNPSGIDLTGTCSGIAATLASEPLAWTRPPDMHARAAGFARGGCVPAGMALVIDALDVYATATGDSNGHGHGLVRVGSDAVFEVREQAGPFQVWFEGLAVVKSGDEDQVAIEVANSSAVELRVRGRLLPLDAAAALEPAPFQPAIAPPGTARAGGVVPKARTWVLTQPAVVLEIRAGAGGGNPNRIDMLGTKSIYVDEVSPEPLSFATPIGMHDPSVAYYEGGRIPRDRRFVVTRVEYEGTSKGDSNGPGEFRVHVAGTDIVRVKTSPEATRGVWEGRIEVAPGRESTVYLEVANSSSGRVRITGLFE